MAERKKRGKGRKRKERRERWGGKESKREREKREKRETGEGKREKRGEPSRDNMREEVFICTHNKNCGGSRGNVKVVTFLYAFYVIRFILHKLFSFSLTQTEKACALSPNGP